MLFFFFFLDEACCQSVYCILFGSEEQKGHSSKQLLLLTISELKALAVVGQLINHNIKVLHMSLYDLTILWMNYNADVSRFLQISL